MKPQSKLSGAKSRNDLPALLRRPHLLAPRPHIAEEEAGDLAHLDFLGAFGDPAAPVMPVNMLERLVPGIADAAMHLHGAVGGLTAQPVRLFSTGSGRMAQGLVWANGLG